VLNSGWLWTGLVVIVLFGVGRLVRRRLNTWARLRAVLARINELNQVGEVGQSMHLLNEVLTDPEIDRFTGTKLEALSFQARIANGVGRLDTALARAQDVVDVRRSAYARRRTRRNARMLGQDLALLGQVHRHLGNYAEALRVYEEVLAVSKHSVFLPTGIQTRIELARLKAGACEFDTARRHAREAVDLSVLGEVLPQQLEALDVEAGIAIARGDLVEGRRVLDVAASLVTPETNPALQVLLLRSWADLERDEGDRDSELGVLFELVRQYCDLKAGHGWRQDQAVLIRQVQEAEARLFELGFAGSLRGDEEATKIYGAALGLLRESEIAQALRLGILQADSEDPGLPQVIKELMFELIDLENPERGAGRAGGAALYEKLEAATSARFRELVELPSRHLVNTVSPGNHLVQLRLIETEDGPAKLYGSWQRPTLEVSAFSHQLTVEEDELLRSATGRSTHSVPTAQAAPVRASASAWAESAQRAALSGEGGDWGRLVDRLLPPELLDVLRRVNVNAPDAEVPLVLLATDGQLWSFPWAALPVTGQTVLIDHAAVAMVPSCSLLEPAAPADNDSRGVLAYLHGVNTDGIEIERSALRGICGKSLREAASPAELTQLLVGADE
jgi:tetratricopeptide (TPR) repeat protein